MCGICGIYNARSGEPVSTATIDTMIRLIAHRGPDDRGVHLAGPLGLGFARLSIIDLSGGHQPMCNETGDVWIVFNGEIWNYKELRKELQERGHIFQTNSDTETIVHAYEEYGVDCIARLHGMFGLALWDGPRHRLLLARDKAGKKPLYYTNLNGNIIFGSEIKAVLGHPQVKREVDVQAMADFLSVRYVPAPATLFKNIAKIKPGHWILFENGQMREECYWDFSFKATEQRPMADYVAGIKQHVQRAVEERMMADVPVGAMLSGGVDSSIIAGIMSRCTNQKVKTFSVGFDQPEYSELPYARMVANHFGTDHHELVVSSADLTQYWPLLTWHRDEPVSEPSDLGVYLISKLARQHVKVVLSGEGADELFAGYPKYVVDWMARYYHILPAALRDQAIQPLLERLPYSMRKLKIAARNLSQPAPQRWMNWFGIFNGPLKEQLLTPATKAMIDLDASREFQHWLLHNPQRDALSSMLYLDTKIWLPDNLLMKGDKMTMAASLESRIPMLDYKLIEYAASIPSQAKIKGLKTKYLLKQAFADFLPTEILTRKKMGFNVPTGIWFREGQRDLISNLLLSERTHSRGFFQRDYIQKIMQDHLAGKTNYQAQIFTLASLELWFRVFIDTPTLEMPQGSMETFLAEEQAIVSAH
ncbi:asparagine synthase (glutamine-hydrolyzing) [Dictyobacter arantiisoli]|uniref:asparagine synthase (glutamine-hydrolyzing) n=1 Tax=Dictyobacter arantiisoli TaxID=2014874 RepID=A0A5A5T9N6_9CHLR|nr:asparagine synthase (glutamine-hydrolyzing) [Dictyobacter arantiisoli]GCF08220.1 asparagine synthetase B [Dictyobacter arantiisoli]